MALQSVVDSSSGALMAIVSNHAPAIGSPTIRHRILLYRSALFQATP